jgi:hypothetical protein
MSFDSAEERFAQDDNLLEVEMIKLNNSYCNN